MGAAGPKEQSVNAGSLGYTPICGCIQHPTQPDVGAVTAIMWGIDVHNCSTTRTQVVAAQALLTLEER